MLKMRLQRVGRRNDPSFRVVLTESRNAADGGKFKEVLGSYNPHINTAQLKTERIAHWLSCGVQPSDTVHNLLVRENVIEGKKINVLPKKRPIAKEQTEEEKAGEKDNEKPDNAEAQNDAEMQSGESSDDAETQEEGGDAESENNEEENEKQEDTPAPDAQEDKEHTETETKQ